MFTHLLIQPRKRSWYFEWATVWIIWAVIVGREKGFFSSAQGPDPPRRQKKPPIDGHWSSLSDLKGRGCELYLSFPSYVEVELYVYIPPSYLFVFTFTSFIY